MFNLKYRQVHLDFHTSEHIQNVGRDFNPGDFSQTLANAGINSITCFSRCHHGWLYYPSEKFPERIHPSLERKNLLGEQIEACHNKGISVPVYLPLQWDELTAEKHPEWLTIDGEGKQAGTAPYEPGFYRMLCLNTPYRDFVLEQALEVLDLYPVDGLFMDIINSRECSCYKCRQDMIASGLNPSIKEVRQTFHKEMIAGFTQFFSEKLRERRPGLSLFYNHSHVRLTHRRSIQDFTHLELESLPSGGWGYQDFPITVRYARTLGVPCVGMTGKFHTAWGDFHSLKNPAALEYECFRSLAYNAGCSIGDQLHPTGQLSESAYQLIGSVYKQVEKKEPWCVGANEMVEIGILSPDQFEGTERGGLSDDISGVCRMLDELSLQFNVIDFEEDFSRYSLILMPDNVLIDEEWEIKKVDAYLAGGGKVLSTYRSGMGRNSEQFLFEDLALRVKGPAPYSPDFFRPEGFLSPQLEKEDYVLYDQGLLVAIPEDTDFVLKTHTPYFNRTWEHFCSHMHAPSTFQEGYPAVIMKKNHIHCVHPLFTTYADRNPRWYKQIIKNCIDKLLPEQLVSHDGPSTLVCALNEQKREHRLVLHLLHYIPERRGRQFDTIEDVIPLYQLKCCLNLDRRVKDVFLVPEMTRLDFEYDQDKLVLVVPQVLGHQMVALEFEG